MSLYVFAWLLRVPPIVQISKKNASVKELKTHLHNLAKFSENQIQRTRVEAEKQQKGETRSSQAKCAKTMQDIQQLRAQFNALIVEDRESEFTLRKVAAWWGTLRGP